MENDAVFRPMASNADCLRFGHHQHGWKLGHAILLVAFSLLLAVADSQAMAAEIYTNARVDDPVNGGINLNVAVIDTLTVTTALTQVTPAPGFTEMEYLFINFYEYNAIAVGPDGSAYMRSADTAGFLGFWGEVLTYVTPEGQIRVLGAEEGTPFAESSQALPDSILQRRNSPSNAMAVNPEGDLIVVGEQETWRLQSDGTLSLFATNPSTLTFLPKAAQYGPDKELYVLSHSYRAETSSRFGRILRFDGTEYVDVFPSLPDLPRSNDFSIDTAGNFYVFDYETDDLLKIDPDGEISTHLHFDSIRSPEAFFVDDEGRVTYKNHRLDKEWVESADLDGTLTTHISYRSLRIGGSNAERLPFGHTVVYIPEPSSLVLAGCGAVSLGMLTIARARRKRPGYKV